MIGVLAWILIIISATIWQIVAAIWVLSYIVPRKRLSQATQVIHASTQTHQETSHKPVGVVETHSKSAVMVGKPDSINVKMDSVEKKSVVTQKDKLKQLRNK